MRHPYQNFALTYSFLPEMTHKNGKQDFEYSGHSGESAPGGYGARGTVESREYTPVLAATEEIITPDKTIPEKKAVQQAKKGLERVNRQLLNEVFDGSDPECDGDKLKEKEKYVKKIKEAIEKVDPDKWYQFCLDHMSYAGNFRQWNKDFSANVLGETNTNAKTERKNAAGLQYLLTEAFVSGGFAFQLREGGKINRFTYVDGMIGGYTVSALRAFLTSRLYAKRKDNWELEYATLSDKVKKQSTRTEFDKAINHLSQLLGEAPKTHVAFEGSVMESQKNNLMEAAFDLIDGMERDGLDAYVDVEIYLAKNKQAKLSKENASYICAIDGKTNTFSSVEDLKNHLKSYFEENVVAQR
ncbi:hypothetical protein JXA05_04575 [Candidatus Peregrinibacteria bacterium]|nr:hypothetical protein [Candidatus Peregrinibacteria bacterium]